nr:HD domain-containing phosphohydrolase [Clostridium sp. J1101437_171009_A5]
MRERTTVLLVDDCAEHRVALRKVLASAYEVIEAADGNEALQMTETYFTQLAAILLDEGMPGIDGLDVLQIMQSKGWLNNIPVFLVTEEESDETMARGYELGVADILVRPLKPEVVKRRVANMVELYRHRFELERVVLEQTARIREQEERLRQTNKSIMEALSAAIEFRNCDSGFHVRRIRQVTRLLLLDVMEHYPEYGLTQEQTDAISELSIMHDIGKIAVPENILTKDGRLTADEFEHMKAHTIYGGELVRHITFPQGERVQRYFYEICRHHHERWDGEGYPDGLKGEEIPIWVQAVSIADVYEALVSRRVYKPAYAAEEAVRMILEGEVRRLQPQDPGLPAPGGRPADRGGERGGGRGAAGGAPQGPCGRPGGARCGKPCTGGEGERPAQRGPDPLPAGAGEVPHHCRALRGHGLYLQSALRLHGVQRKILPCLPGARLHQRVQQIPPLGPYLLPGGV